MNVVFIIWRNHADHLFDSPPISYLEDYMKIAGCKVKHPEPFLLQVDDFSDLILILIFLILCKFIAPCPH